MKENIEEVIERLEKSINDVWFSTTYSQEDEERDLRVLLSDYKRVLKENEELKKELGRVTSGRNQLFEYATAQQVNPEMLHKVLRVEYIPKQKVKDKIEELNKKEKQELKGTKGQDRYDIKQQYMYQRNILQDLLEEKGE